MSILNKLYGILVYGTTITIESPYYKKHSKVSPVASSLSLKNALLDDIAIEDIQKAAYLICSLLPESSAWEEIAKVDTLNTYTIPIKDSNELRGIASKLRVDQLFSRLPILVREENLTANWVDKLGIVALQILKGTAV